MSNVGDTSAAYCPSCGASVAMDGDKGTCTYCGTVVERQRAADDRPRFTATQVKLQYPPPSSYSTFNPPAAARRGSALGVGIALSLFFIVVGIGVGLVIAGGVASRLTSGGSTTPGNGVTPAGAPSPAVAIPSIGIGSINELVTGLPRDGAGNDLLVYVNNPNDQGLSVALIDGGSHTARWKSRPLSKQAYRGRLVAGIDAIYLTDEERLLALRLSDGSVAWETSLAAEPNCDDCLRLVKERVVVMQKDGSLQGFDARTGQRSWSISLDDPPRRLPVVGDRLMLLQPAKQGGKLVSLLDPASGKEVQRIEPSCPSTHFSDQQERPDDSTPLLFSPDGGTIYALFGFFNQCAQRWDVASGKRTWQIAVEDNVVPASWSSSSPPLLTDNALFINVDKGDQTSILAMDTASGAFRKVIEVKKRKFIPVAARDGILIVLTWPSWDSNKQSLLGLDAKTGEQRWEFTPQAKDARVTTGHGHWDWRLTPKGLLVVQVLEDQKQLVVETLDPKTGTSTGKQTTALEGSGSHVFWDVLWADDTAWLDIGSSIYALDLTTGATAYRLN